MTEELKIRVEDESRAKNRIKEVGADLEKKVSVKDTYFQGQGEDELKITETGEGEFLRKYEKKDSGFQQVKNDEVENPDEKKQQLEQQFGIKTVQQKEISYYSLGDKTIILNRIRNTGVFLIQGENVRKEFLEEELGFENSEYIEAPFSDLE
ncbi:MAG: hypothetical protein ABEJ56_03735 [Candidatus Nanohaloarchaea archaeon]